MEFFPYDWIHTKDDSTDDLIINAWCLNRQSESCLVQLQSYKTFCHVELPTTVNDGDPIEWTPARIKLVMDYISFCGKEKKPVSYDVVEKLNLYYYKCDLKSKFLILYFKNNEDMFYMRKILHKPKCDMHQCYRVAIPRSSKCVTHGDDENKKKEQPKACRIRNIGLVLTCVWEAEISPIRKFLSCKNAEFAQWFTLSDCIAVPKEKRISTCKHEYSVNWEKFTPISNDKSQSWRVQPTMLAIDIETYSPNHKTMPDPRIKGNVVYMISCIFYRLYDCDSIKKYALIFGDCNDIPGSTVIRSSSEVELIRDLEKLILSTDPDIVTGYNHMGYDYMFLEKRLKRELKQWAVSGRLLDTPSKMVHINMNSKQTGKNSMYNLLMPGRINIDLYPLMRTGYKLDMYKLDFVSKHFLGETKHDVKAEEMFRIYQRSMDISVDRVTRLQEMTKVMDYCIQDSMLVVKLFEKTDVWIDLVQRASILGVTIVDIFTQGQQVKCVSQIYHECFINSIVMDHKDDGKFSYEGGFVGEPIKGLHENVICLDFASMYPSVMIANNISYETLVAKDYNDKVDDKLCNVYSIQSKDIFEDSPTDKADDGDDSDSDDDDHEQDKAVEELRKLKMYNFKFVKTEVKEGIIPKIVRKLVTERKVVKKMMEKTDDPFVKNMLDKRQNALKIAGNSVYGFLAAYKLPLIQGAMAITWQGRDLITRVNNYLIQNYPSSKIVYNDTDSVMVDLQIKDGKDCIKIGKALGEEITKLFPPPIKIEFEKGMRILNLKKKKYCALLIEDEFLTNGDINPLHGQHKKILKRGIVTARRDNCLWMRQIYDDCLLSILKMKTLDETLKVVFDRIVDLFEGRVEPKDLSIIGELGSNYKSDNFPMKVFADELRRQGKQVTAGDRLQFLIVDAVDENGEKEDKLGKKYMLLEDFVDNTKLFTEGKKSISGESKVIFVEGVKTVLPKIDILYYLEKKLMNPIEQLLTVGYDFVKFSHVWYRPRGKKRDISVAKVLKTVGQMITDHPDRDINSILKEYKDGLKLPKINLLYKKMVD